MSFWVRYSIAVSGGWCLDREADSQEKEKRGVQKHVYHTPSSSIAIDQKQPLDPTISTKDFFEHHGIFALPLKLIEYIDKWRGYREQKEEYREAKYDAGCILSGFTGTGKTTIAKLIGDILGGECVVLSASSIKQKLVDLLSPPPGQFRVVVLDEIDGLLIEDEPSSHYKSILRHFLSVVNGEIRRNPHYVVIGTTNKYDSLPPAVLHAGPLSNNFVIGQYKPIEIEKLIHYSLVQDGYELATTAVDDEGTWDEAISYLCRELASQSNAGIVIYIEGIKQKIRQKKRVEKKIYITDILGIENLR